MSNGSNDDDETPDQTIHKVVVNGRSLQGRNLQGRNLQGRNLQGRNLQGRGLQGARVDDAGGADAQVVAEATPASGALVRITHLAVNGINFTSTDAEALRIDALVINGVRISATGPEGLQIQSISLETDDTDADEAPVEGAESAAPETLEPPPADPDFGALSVSSIELPDGRRFVGPAEPKE
jgi:hypothetical protein